MEALVVCLADCRFSLPGIYEIQLCMSHTCPQEHITLLYTSVVVVVYSECSILQADREADSTSSHLRLAAPRGAGQPA